MMTIIIIIITIIIRKRTKLFSFRTEFGNKIQEALLLGSARILQCPPERKGGLLLPTVILLGRNYLFTVL